MITAKYDLWINTHDDAQSFIRSMCEGCTVKFERHPQATKQGTMRYRIKTKRLGSMNLSFFEIYTLPIYKPVLENYLKSSMEKHFDRQRAFNK